MANPKHLEMLEKGADVWNEWRQEAKEEINLISARLQEINLSGYDFSGSNLQGADLTTTNLAFSNLARCNLSHTFLAAVNFFGADLSKANLTKSISVDSSFHDASLSGSLFTDGIIRRTHFQNTLIHRTDFTNCILLDSAFANVDLSETIGLETVYHRSPSSVGIDTFFKSKGKIPEVFLQGCGVPDDVIKYMNSLVNAQNVIQFYSCFISYSTKDEEFAQRLYSKMRDSKLRVWFAPEDMKGGLKMHDQIDTAIRIYDKLLVVLSEESMKSEWVVTEIRKAVSAEIKEGKRKLFPITLVDRDKIKNWNRIDAATGKDLAEELLQYHIPDFSNWKNHDDFEAAFSKLLRDLKADENLK